jgi:hypothetical protein
MGGFVFRSRLGCSLGQTRARGGMTSSAVLSSVAHNFPRNSRPNLAQYISERLEMTPNGFGGKEGQNKKRKLVYEKSKYPIQEDNSTHKKCCSG